jgi:ABC-type phosphate transport system permease subunit
VARWRLRWQRWLRRRIVLPFTKNGVIGGVMLGLGRALGETMAVTFIIGNTYQLDSITLDGTGSKEKIRMLNL